MPAPFKIARPGMHSHNASRLLEQEEELTRGPFHRLRLILFLVGFACLGFYLYTLADQYVYQAYENWAFDQQIAGNINVSFEEFLRTKFSLRYAPPAKIESNEPAEKPNLSRPHLAEGDLLGRVSISRLKLSAVIREGVDQKTLQNAVGHVPMTALPGGRGNFAIAAHRDTLFRALKDIQIGDQVTVQSAAGTYTYAVVTTRIVKPSDVSVLRSDGGGFVPVSETGNLLTMITCYPFHYVGAAPKRFIVEARLISSGAPVPNAA
jgi:sortase A